MLNALRITVTCLALTLIACQGGSSDSDRQPIGKADTFGSCEGACGGAAPDGNCFCDAECVTVGDCCEDSAQFCSIDECAGEFTCALFCENGFKTNELGCSLCECAEPTVCEPVLCGLFCENGFETDDDGCEICECAEPACEPVTCELFCENGFATDDDGCEICQCAPPTCAPVTCELFCENGFATDDDGCEICECKQPLCDDLITCGLFCEFGFETDDNGCEICACADP